MAKCVDTREAYENLANAIIISAVTDYKDALKHAKRNREKKTEDEKRNREKKTGDEKRSRERENRDVKRLEKFFCSEWYEVLTDMDATYLLRKVREIVEEGR